MNRFEQIVSKARVAPIVDWEPGEGFVTEVNGRRYRLGGEPDAARRNYVALVEDDREAA
jgi:hypothetical protein